MRCLLSLALVALFPFALNAADEGVLPVGADGKPLNLDFETGALKDWVASGEAFKDQPIKGDTVSPRRGDNRSRHQGQFWIGGYEKLGDKPTGTLTSVPFKVTHRWVSFLVGGGPWKETRVEIVSSKEVIHKASGTEAEDMYREVVDLNKHMGKEIQIRIVDEHTGHWGHINFDDFRFHQEKPVVPKAQGRPSLGVPDKYINAGLSPEKAAAAMTVPEDFKVTLFAGEPDVHQPIAFCIDDRGRLWVAECYTYPKRHPHPGPIIPEDPSPKRGGEKDKKDTPPSPLRGGGPGGRGQRLGDRILIFEDTDGDGKFDKKTTFIEGLNLICGLEIGFGGVWVGAAPYLLFIPDKNGDDKPDGPPEILLDGWDAVSDTHETLNTFIWGPDGWLYGCHGVFTKSLVGKPGTPAKDRVPLNCCVWRYHPTRHAFEVFAHGTSNPWGLDYNEHGEFFIEACVIPHCFHMIQGGRYLRQAGQHFNPYTYADIGTIADHLHYVGANPHGGNLRSDSAGGGHAHCGLMCYLGGAWPKKYHGALFMGNIHGKRINMDILKQKGSGYVASHGPDFLLANDEWARFINLKYGPDGNVYLIDWYDKQACHLTDPQIWDRTNGRVYKISYRGTKPVTGIDLQKCTDEELVKYQLSDNEWYVRHARRILQERSTKLDKKTRDVIHNQIVGTMLNQPDAGKRLRGLWALHAIASINQEVGSACMSDKSPLLRGWIQTVTDDGKYERPPCGTSYYGSLSTEDPIVRRRILSGIIRFPDDKAGNAERGLHLSFLTQAKGDENDHNLQYLLWYALEPLAAHEPNMAIEIAVKAQVGMLLQFTARRIATTSAKAQNELLAGALAKAADDDEPDKVRLILRGMTEGFRGRKDVPTPADWSATADKLAKLESAEARSLATSVSMTFGDPKAFATMRGILANQKTPNAERLAALAALVNGRDKELAPVLQNLIATPGLRGPAIRALAGYNDPKTPAVILANWKSYSTEEQRDALNTLASRPTYANALLDAVADKRVQPSDISADIIRAMRNLPDKTVAERITKVWGVVRDTPAERKQDIAAWKKKIAPAGKDDLMLGRALYAKTCQNCHTLYGVGGKIGPDITGSNRSNLDYLLENVFDPSGVIPKDYAQTVLYLKNGRTVTGILKGDPSFLYTVQTPNEVLVINAGDVDEIKPSAISIMPDDQMKPFSTQEVRALFAYLRHSQQVPMLATTDNAKDFFNGKDLTGWLGDPKLWSVDNGEIVGKTSGLKKNEFLMSTTAAENFRLSLKVKLTPNAGNSGVQFRSEPIEGGEMRGPQADIGAGWWGKLYEENGRALIEPKGGEQFVKPGDWNDYAVEAIDGNVKIWINGNLCTDRKNDTQLSRRGIFGLQLHSGGAQEVRFKELKLEVLPRK